MLVKIIYRKENGIFSGMPYTYRTKLPLKRGDTVKAPTRDKLQIGFVTDVNVPESAVEPRWRDNLKEITEYATRGEPNA